MGLTDREKQIIDEMERAFKSEDPRLVSTLEKARPSLLLNIIAISLGMAALLAGVATKITLLGIAGFLVALVGAATIRLRPRGFKAPKVKGRMQDRWNKRNQ